MLFGEWNGIDEEKWKLAQIGCVNLDENWNFLMEFERNFDIQKVEKADRGLLRIQAILWLISQRSICQFRKAI